MRKKRSILAILQGFMHRIIVIVGSIALTLAFFLVLPLMQTLANKSNTDTIVRDVNTAKLEAPDPPPEPEAEEEPEPEEEPPELEQQSKPLALNQLELALNPNVSEGMLSGDFTVNLKTVGKQSKDVDELFSLSDLDQKPRVVYQPSPNITEKMRQQAPGTVYVIFIVNQSGKVENPQVQKSTDPIFEKPALNAVKQWKFEPGKRQGEPVRFRMRVPITFPK